MVGVRSLASFFVLSSLVFLANADTFVFQTALIIVSTIEPSDYVVATFQGYGSPYQLFQIPQTGAQLPVLETTSGGDTVGNFGLLIILAQASYDYGGDIGWTSALTDPQWDALYAYQVKYGVRMVQLNTYPDNIPGVQLVNSSNANSSSPGCCMNDEQYVELVDGFPMGGLLPGNLSTQGLWHYPAVVLDPLTVTPFLVFEPNAEYHDVTVAGVVKDWGPGREEIDFFIAGFNPSLTSTYLGHIWFQWGYRGLYGGYRRVYFNTQVDDVFLTTVLHTVSPNPQGPRPRITPGDLENHITWQGELNTAMNNGSDYILELGFNGDGNLQQAYPASDWTCPIPIIRSDPPSPDVNAEFVKPLDTGTSMWPPNSPYDWSLSCAL